MLEFLAPVEHFGHRFDRGSILFEFDALREPERTQFPIIGAYLRARGVEFNEVPTPQMLWRGKLWPDLYIANQLDAAEGAHPMLRDDMSCHAKYKAHWSDTFTLEEASSLNHGGAFHVAFIEPLCRKIAGRSSAEIAAKYHRAIWIPLYWPQTLRARQSIATPFYYPRAGYAGAAIPGDAGAGRPSSDVASRPADAVDAIELSTAFALAVPRQRFSVAFIVDDSPIYRVTDQEECAGGPTRPLLHRLIVEYRGECDVHDEMARLGFVDRIEKIAYGSARLQLPTLSNVAAGWTPRPHINAQLWSIINDET